VHLGYPERAPDLGRAYLDRGIREGKTKREAMRSLRRHISRELFKRLADIALT
jgi:hypothetical protein